MRRVGIGINAIVFLAALVAWFYAAVLAPISGMARVTELDRAGVFDQVKLRAYSPELAENLRCNVANWIQEKPRSLAVFYAEYLAGLAVFNIAALFFSGRWQANPRQSASSPP